MGRRPGNQRPTTLDLFAGAGGFSIGLERAGFRSVGAIELNARAAETWASAHPEGILWGGPQHGDMRRIDPRMVKRRLAAEGIRELDLVTAGPPCQGFSRVGRAKLNSLADKAGAFRRDPRNVLFRRAIDFLEVLQPRAFIFENVVGILHLAGTNMAEVVCEAIREVGYDVRCAVLNAAWYGVPQMRERVVIIGIRADLGVEPEFPVITHRIPHRRGMICTAELDDRLWEEPAFFVQHDLLPRKRRLSPAVSVQGALNDLPPFTAHLEAKRAARKMPSQRPFHPAVAYRRGRANSYGTLMRRWPGHRSVDVHDHFCRFTPRDFGTFRGMRPGDRYPEALAVAHHLWERAKWDARERGARPPPARAFVPPYRNDGFPDKWRKLIPDEPSWTITAHLAKDTYSHIHYDSAQARMITPREAARLQSFPDGMHFHGNTGEMFTQIGNAVPPLLATAIGAAVQKTLLGATGSRRHRRVA